MTKETFATWVEEQSYYVTETEFKEAQDQHGVIVTLPTGITILWDENGNKNIPARDIRHGDWAEK